MKKLTFILSFIFTSAIALAQEPIILKKVTVDEFTGGVTKEIYSKVALKKKETEFSISESEVSLIFLYSFQPKESQKSYALGMLFYSTECQSEYDGKIELLFEDGTSLEFAQISKTDCGSSFKYPTYALASRKFIDSDPAILESEGNKNLSILAEKRLVKIRISQTVFTLKENAKDLLMKYVEKIEED